MVVIEDIRRNSAWEITDSILPYIAGSLLSYGPSSAKLIVKDSRKECTCSFSEKPIELRDKINQFSLQMLICLLFLKFH